MLEPLPDPVDSPPTEPEPQPEPEPEPQPDPTDVAVTLGGVLTCPAPQLRGGGGYEPMTWGGDWDVPWIAEQPEEFEGGGLTVQDFDGDGRLDVFLPGAISPKLYLQLSEGIFTDATTTHLPEGDTSRSVMAGAGDADGDGDLDLLITRFRRQSRLWLNDGSAHFVDATEGAGLDAPDHRSTGVTWEDWDRDGDLDLAVAGYGAIHLRPIEPGHPTLLYRNNGDGTFDDATELLPDATHDGLSFIAGFHDLDGDGWAELYTVNDFGPQFPNALAWNREGVFELDDGTAGLHVGIQGMGLAWGDLDDDGVVDVTVAGWNNNRVMVHHQGQWFDQHRNLGLDPDSSRAQYVAWGTDVADLDNDGDLDMVQGYGMIFNQDTAPAQPDEVYRQVDDGTFEPVGLAWGWSDEGQTRAVIASDLDGDGWVDLMRRDLAGPTTVHRARCGADTWLTVRPRMATGGNRFAIGATVRVTAGDRTWERRIHGGDTSIFTSRPPEAHFGLGTVETVDRVEVEWPDGRTRLFHAVPARQVVELTLE